METLELMNPSASYFIGISYWQNRLYDTVFYQIRIFEFNHIFREGKCESWVCSAFLESGHEIQQLLQLTTWIMDVE